MLRWAVLLVLMTGSAVADEYSAVTKSDAALRGAPSATSVQMGVVRGGTPVEVDVCFYEGAFCHVSGNGLDGYVAGDLLVLTGETTTLRVVEQERWNKIRKQKRLDAIPDYEVNNIVVYGDSLSFDTFGDELERLLPQRKVRMAGIPGQDGAVISTRMLADFRNVKRLKIIWDRHWPKEPVAKYIADLKPGIDYAASTGDFLIVSDIRQLVNDSQVNVAEDAKVTDEINKELKRLYPNNFVDVTSVLESVSIRTTDGVHPTQAGYEGVANVIAQAITARTSVASSTQQQ